MTRGRVVRYAVVAAVGLCLLGAGVTMAAARGRAGAPAQAQVPSAVNVPPELNDANSWAFAPPEDKFTDNALLDLRSLNEKVAGEKGFLRLSEDGNSFVLGDGTPVRFWAVDDDSPGEAGGHGAPLPLPGQARRQHGPHRLHRLQQQGGRGHHGREREGH